MKSLVVDARAREMRRYQMDVSTLRATKVAEKQLGTPFGNDAECLIHSASCEKVSDAFCRMKKSFENVLYTFRLYKTLNTDT